MIDHSFQALHRQTDARVARRQAEVETGAAPQRINRRAIVERFAHRLPQLRLIGGSERVGKRQIFSRRGQETALGSKSV